ncbi:hypothetical protein LHJ74_33290 [Streptomyces sp. N2-109]|uniref:Uncharacterized protein n=1 Tax=Streptomyces gossypii TaxID=2883101 RepID=A0ABT2K3I5_9ACTN|nr:hypothetical protein [Streptomyces gossypii]MCT2594734.1 hypothetical protein [Streptomyces gossypii]
MSRPYAPEEHEPRMPEEDGLGPGLFDLERELLELPCVREAVVLPVRLPEVGEVALLAFVPLGYGQETAGRRAVLAACGRCLPGAFAHAVATDGIPRGASGAVRSGLLLDQLLPQIARDLVSPFSMSD